MWRGAPDFDRRACVCVSPVVRSGFVRVDVESSARTGRLNPIAHLNFPAGADLLLFTRGFFLMSLDARLGVSRTQVSGSNAGAHDGPRRRAASRGSRLRRASLVFCTLAAALVLGACGEKSLTKVAGEDEAIEIITILRQSGIAAEKQEVGESSAREWEIVVGGSDYDLANRLLLYYELPRRGEKPPEANLFSYEAERQAQQLKESRKQIEQHLRKLNGVARASVIISPQQDDAGSNPAPAKATVNVTHKEPQAPFGVDEVRQAVANSYPTLKPENVFVRLQFEPPPSAPKREPGIIEANKTIFAVGAGLAAGLTALLFILLRRVRLQRLRLAAMEAASKPEEEAEATDEEEDKPRLIATTTKRHADQTAGAGRRGAGE